LIGIGDPLLSDEARDESAGGGEEGKAGEDACRPIEPELDVR
jgi:hypothetical protein